MGFSLPAFPLPAPSDWNSIAIGCGFWSLTPSSPLGRRQLLCRYLSVFALPCRHFSLRTSRQPGNMEQHWTCGMSSCFTGSRMPGVDLAETKYDFVAEFGSSDIHRHLFPRLVHRLFLALSSPFFGSAPDTDSKWQVTRFFFCECEVGMCVSSRFWVASVLRGNSHDIANVLESHAATSILSHHVVLSQWEGNFTWSGSSFTGCAADTVSPFHSLCNPCIS